MKRREAYLRDDEVLAYLNKLEAEEESDDDYLSNSSSDDESDDYNKPVSH